MPNRSYNFELPYTIPGWKLQMGLGQYKSDLVYALIPPRLRAKLEQGEATGEGVTIHKKDLDALPDTVWNYVSARLGLG